MRKIEGGWYAFGTPVHGTSSYCENKKAPISAIIILKQWEENLLVKADPFSALSSSLSEFYRPRMRSVDKRNSHDGQIKTRLEAFLEMIETGENKPC